MNKLKTLPGMTDLSVEFFSEGGQMKMIKNAQVLPFTEISFMEMEILKNEIQNDQHVISALKEMQPDSEIKRIEQFVLCRFGGLDHTGDIVDGVLQDGEYWPCPFHGTCKHEGTLCKLPMANGQRLVKEEIDILQLTATDKTNEVIAEELGFCLGTYHKIKRLLYEKLNILTKQEAAVFAFINNII
jgi:DNA-binding CsgD family transcriptional regulator